MSLVGSLGSVNAPSTVWTLAGVIGSLPDHREERAVDVDRVDRPPWPDGLSQLRLEQAGSRADVGDLLSRPQPERRDYGVDLERGNPCRPIQRFDPFVRGLDASCPLALGETASSTARIAGSRRGPARPAVRIMAWIILPG